MKNIASSVLMVRPANFMANEQTRVNNYFQQESDAIINTDVNTKAQEEFDSLVEKLIAVGIEVIVVQDTLEPHTPDSVFPNNWISFHQNGDVAFYPMFAPNRRAERREDILDIIEDKGFSIVNIVDYSSAEEDGFFLEGTGSIVIDRKNNKAYCALSARSDEELFIEFCEDFDLAPVIFEAFHDVNKKRELIYHTNVMLSIGENFALLCPNSIDDKQERKMVLDHLKKDNKEIILIAENQLSSFVGNIIQLQGANNQNIIVLSTKAHQGLTPIQVEQLSKHGKLVSSDLDIIERCGGGSARCMIAEIFCKKIKV